ncbi:MAG TPA: glycosyl hydrolase [Chthoniobacterales bacterium]|nr:glycosyl hydrolase [Chthoniobacterales bacterium]
MRSLVRLLLVTMTVSLAMIAGLAEEEPDPPAFGFAIEGMPTRSEMNSLESATGVRPSIIMFYLQWPSEPETGIFPGDALRSIEASGALPVLTWEPKFLDSEKREQMIPAESISAGKYDSYLRRFARESRQFGKPYLIRFAHEMNLARYHWGGSAQEFGPDSAEKYRAMFRHVVGVFRAQKANGVRWVFCPNADSEPAMPWNQIAPYYPGNDVVDIVGLDGYNWGTTQTRAANGWDSEWRSFESIFAAPLQELKRIAPEKPAAVFETSSASKGGNKEEWILAALGSAKSLGLTALIWFELDKEIDWRLETNVSTAVRLTIDRESASSAVASGLLGH